ncbi:unnamed protein product [Rhizophagus irregularis]|nr:unnamed protein product [Rhizophagus irregularis]
MAFFNTLYVCLKLADGTLANVLIYVFISFLTKHFLRFDRGFLNGSQMGILKDCGFLDGSQMGILKDRGFPDDSWTGPQIFFSKRDFELFNIMVFFLENRKKVLPKFLLKIELIKDYC